MFSTIVLVGFVATILWYAFYREWKLVIPLVAFLVAWSLGNFRPGWLMWAIGDKDLFWVTVGVAAGGTFLLILAECSLLEYWEGRLPGPIRAGDLAYSWVLGSLSIVAAGFCIAIAVPVTRVSGLLPTIAIGELIALTPVMFVNYVRWQQNRLLLSARE